ncbi:MAG: PDZ domain-containing protein [Betaproteobacteria bacterium]|nr:MAG: PDZ domain-containing protein [Betaproteobacteria bacterium]
MVRKSLCVLLAASAAGCAPPPMARAQESVVPGTIGVAVARDPEGVAVRALREDGAAAAAGLRTGDIIVRYNGMPVADEREFNRLVADSVPGTRARVQFLRSGTLHSIDVPVRQLDTEPRG